MSEDKPEYDFIKALKDLPRATPPPEVWANIERITTQSARIRTLSRSDWQRTAVAAAVLLFLNTAAVFWSLGQDSGSSSITVGNDVSLISDYQLYE